MESAIGLIVILLLLINISYLGQINVKIKKILKLLDKSYKEAKEE
jgi:hypothetical protein